MQWCSTTQCNATGSRRPGTRRTAASGLIVIAFLVIVGLSLVHVLRDMSKVQDCVMQGRTNCAPIQ